MQVGDALRVVHRAVGAGLVVVGGTVLADVQRQAGRLAVVPHDQLVQAGRVDAPAHLRALARRLVEGHVVGGRPRRVVARAVTVGARRPGVGVRRRDHGRRVVVEADRVDRLADLPQVAVLDERPVRHRRRRLQQGLRVGAVQDRAVEDPAGQIVDPAGRRQVLRLLRQRADDRGVEADRHRVAGRHHRPQGHRAQTVPQVQVVRGAQRGRGVGAAGSVHPGGVAQEGRAPGLVERDPLLHAVAERLAHDLRVLREPVRGVPLRPAARVLQLLRQVPVVEGDGRFDPGGQQLVHQAAVEVQAALDGGAAAGRLHPGPGDGEAVRAEPQVLHQRHVVAVAVVVVDSDVTGVPAGRLPGGVAEGVPDRGRAAVLAHRALDLVRRGRGAPEEGRGEGHRGHRRCGLKHGSAPIAGRVTTGA